MSALFRWVSLRHLLHERTRTALTVVGVALGVAVFVAMRLASHSALASFADTVDAVAGRANLQVAGTSEGFDERVFPWVRTTPGVAAAAPIVQLYAPARIARRAAPLDTASGRGRYDLTMMVLGVDVFEERPFERWREDAPTRAAALEFLADPRAVAVPRAFADRERLVPGDTLEVVASGVPVPLVVRRVLAAEGLGQAFGGNVAVVDIATAQEVFRRAGRLDRIDLRVAPGRMAAVRAALAARLPADVEVETPAGRTRQVEGMVSAFALNLTALSFIAIFVATFLVFDAVAMAVVRRRRELGILRSLGVTRARLVRLVLTEALALGVAGSLLGLALGTLMARGALAAVARTLTDLYLVAHTDRLAHDPATYAAGLLLGIGSALVSALIPALEAARTPPAATVRQGAHLEAARMPVARWAWGGLALLALAAAVSWWTVAERQPLGGFASAFLTLAGFSLLAPAATLLGERAGAPLARRLCGIEGALGARFLREAVARTSVAVAALMVAVGMLVALEVMVGSFRRTVDTWVRQSIRGDLYVEPLGHRLNGSATRLPPELVDAARALPGVAAVDTYRGARIRYEGALVSAIGVDLAVQRDHGHLRFLAGDPRAILDRARARGEALVTESFAHHHRVHAGDSLTLATPGGRARLRVAGVFIDYSTDAGAVFVDRAVFARLWRDPRTESFAIYLAPGADGAGVARALTAAAGPGRLLAVTPNQALRERVLRVFDQTFQITYALQSIAILVAVLGVIGTLTALVIQRGREIAVLRACGAQRGQIQRMVLVESALLGLIGAALGCVAGVALALILVHLINRQFFGWSLTFTLDPWVLVRALGLLGGTATLAGLVPARLAARRVAREALRVE